MHRGATQTVTTGCEQPVVNRIVGVGTLARVVLTGVLWGTSLAASAHPLSVTDTTLRLGADGSFTVELIADLDALALGAPQAADDAELVATLRRLPPAELQRRVDRLRALFTRRVRVRFDGEPAAFEVQFPDYGTAQANDAQIPTVLGLTARLTGTIPTAATSVEFFASRSFAVVHLTILDEARDAVVRSVLERGARSDPFELAGPVPPASGSSVARRYLGLGFTHIVPRGVDHVLFVLGLYLLSARLRPLVWQVTAFTLAHALTLTLSTLAAFELSSRVVEPLIALSIAYVAIENMLTDKLHRWRPAVVFMFGLLHGLGFAGVLRTLGLPDDERLLGLMSFNVGIELGQLLVIAGALASIGWFRARAWYRRRVVIPVSAGIAAIGLIWAAQRVLAA